MNDKLTNDQPMAMRSLIVVFGCLVAFWVARNTLRIERKVLVAQEPPVADATTTDKDADDRNEAPVRDAARAKAETSSLDPYQGKTDASTATSARTLPEVPVRSQSDPDEKRVILAKREDEVLALQLELQAQQRELGNDHPKVKATKEKLRVVERWLTDQRKEPQRSMVIKVTGREAKEVELILQDAYGELANFVSDPTTGNVVISIRQEVKSPVVEKLLNEIWGTATKLNRAQAENDKQTTRNFPDDARDRQYDRAAKELALKAGDATPEQRDALRKQLRQITEQQFDHRQKQRQQEFESLGKRLDELKAAQARRQTNRSTIVERRVDELLNPDADLKWDTVDPTADPTQSNQPGFALNGAPLGNTAMIPQDKPRKSAFEKKSSTQHTPTYNGMTLEQAIQTMASDRKPEKLVEAVLAAYYLQSAADERELSQTVLQMLRFQNIDNSMSSNEAGFVEPLKQLSLAVLMRLPSDLVVEDLVAELKAHGTKKSLREFFQHLLLAYSSYGPIYSPIRTANNGMTVLITVNAQERTDAANRLRDSIRSRARTIARCLAETTQEEPKAGLWAVRCGLMIADMIKQPISSFEAELAPIAERYFNDSMKNPSRTFVQYSDPVVLSAKLLAGCNRRTDDVTKFAMSRVEIWRQELEKADKTQEDIGVAKIALSNAVEIFLALAPNENNASQELINTLFSVWDQSKTQTFKYSPPIPKINQSVYQFSVVVLVDAMGQLGIQARGAIPILQGISESDAAGKIATSNQGFNGGRSWRKVPSVRREAEKLSELAKAAIQAIEEARPAAPPEPLPEDIAGNEVSRSEITRGVAEDQRSQNRNEASSIDAQPTFKGMALDQAVRLMTTDRDPEKLIDALLAVYHLYEPGDSRQMMRAILQMMRHQGLNISANSGTSADVLGQASTAVLMRFPADVVIEEFLSELRAGGANKSSREVFELFLVLYPGIQNVYVPTETTATRSKILLQLNPTDVAESAVQLDNSILLRVRTLMKVIASIAGKDPSASWWAISCSSQIANITKQPKTAFRTQLEPIAERILRAPEDERVRHGVTSPENFRNVVKLIAELNPRSDDLTKIVKQKIEAWKQAFEIKGLSNEEMKERLLDLAYAEDILVSMNSRAEEVLSLLGELLAFAWSYIDPANTEDDNRSVKSRLAGMRMGSVTSQLAGESIFSLVDTMARIGHPAQSQIKMLKTFEESPLSTRVTMIEIFGQQWPKPFRMNNRTITLKEFIGAAIRTIEEAKPVEPPKPVPEDVDPRISRD